MAASPVKREGDDNMHAEIEILARSADRLTKRSQHTARDAVLMLLTAATVTAIR